MPKVSKKSKKSKKPKKFKKIKKKFLAVYIGSDFAMSQWESLSAGEKAQREKAGMVAWTKWAKKYQKVLVDFGNPLGSTLRVDKNGITSTVNALAVYTLIEAKSHQEAATIFLEHPHFTLFPGDSVEIMECLPLPL